MRPDSDRLDGASRDKLTQRGLRNADVAADTDEPNTPFRDEPPGEADTRSQQIGGLSDGEQTVGSGNVVSSL
jgi:hypothetical protein